MHAAPRSDLEAVAHSLMRYSLARLFADTDINQHGSGPLTQLGIHGKQRTLITISNKPIVSATLQGVVTHLAKEWTTHWRNQCPLDWLLAALYLYEVKPSKDS